MTDTLQKKLQTVKSLTQTTEKKMLTVPLTKPLSKEL